MSLIRDSLKKVQENSDQKDAFSVDSSIEIAGQPPQKKKAPTLLFIVVGIGVIALAGFFFFFTSPGEKPKLPAPKIESPLVAQAPNPTAPPAIQPQPAVPTPGTQPVAGKIPSPKVEMKDPVAAAREIPGKPPIEKEKPGISTSRITPKPMPPVMGTDEKKPARLEDQGLTPKAVHLKRTEKAAKPSEGKKTIVREREGATPTGQPETVRSHESTFFPTYSKAYALQQAGQLTQAVSLYKEILQEDPNNAYVLNNLGVIQQQQGDFRQAIVYYEKAHEVNPKFTQALNNLGVVFYRIGDYEQSQQWLEKSLQIQPDNGAVLQNLALVYKKKGHKEEAKQILRKAIQADPQVPEFYFNLARLEEETGNYGQALKNYQEFLRTRGTINDKLSQDVIRQIEKLSSQQPASK